MLPTPKQFLALLVGLVLWALLDHMFTPTSLQVWYAFEFSIPLCTGLAIGLLNEQESIASILLLSFLLGAINFVYQVVNPAFNPWTLYDAFLLSAFSFTCFIAAFVVTLSLRIVTLQTKLSKASILVSGGPEVTAESRFKRINLDEINKQLPKVVTLLGILVAIVEGVVKLLVSIHGVGK